MTEENKNQIKKAAWGSVGPAKMVSLRMPIDLIEKLNAESKGRGVSKNQIIVAACYEALGENENEV
jgi:predicted DNA-binding protein